MTQPMGRKLDVKYAKRTMAKGAIDEAARLIAETSDIGGAGSYASDRWRRARALAVQAADQLRQSEGIKE